MLTGTSGGTFRSRFQITFYDICTGRLCLSVVRPSPMTCRSIPAQNQTLGFEGGIFSEILKALKFQPLTFGSCCRYSAILKNKDDIFPSQSCLNNVNRKWECKKGSSLLYKMFCLKSLINPAKEDAKYCLPAIDRLELARPSRPSRLSPVVLS